jgi:23S rRNA (cytidine1920-2'-O)/16S rRNA (cytidine1409-2'-O)-methyltransferase
MKAEKKRLDVILVEQGFVQTVSIAAALIGVGRVAVNGDNNCKAGNSYRVDSEFIVRDKKPFVSRGGKKLAAGLAGFGIEPAGLICADIGCSTGGFTDCLLQQGALRVYAVDVGYGLLDWTLRQDSRVVVLERCNARYLSSRDIPEPIDLCVIDASFISLELLLGPVSKLFADEITIIALVKPQFELPREKVAKGGVVHEEYLQREALDLVEKFCHDLGLKCQGVVRSPLKGAKGNQEYLLHLSKYSGWAKKL